MSSGGKEGQWEVEEAGRAGGLDVKSRLATTKQGCQQVRHKFNDLMNINAILRTTM